MFEQNKVLVFKWVAFVFIMSVICLPFGAIAQQTSWLKQTWGEQVGSFYVDKTGNSYAVGTYFQWGKTIDGVTLNSTGHENVFTAKYSPKGKLLWAATSTSSNSNNSVQGMGICANANGEVFITGYFAYTLLFDAIELHTNSGLTDIFLTKYSTEGKTLWTQAIGGMNSDFSYEVKLDDSSNCYLAGRFEYPFKIGDSVFYGSNFGMNNFFIAKLDTHGKLIWVHRGTGTSCPKIKVMPAGDLFACGQYQYDFTWESDTIASKGGIDYYLLKLHPNGETNWVTTLNGSDYNNVHSFNIDQEGDAYLLGSSEGYTYLNDSLISKFPNYDYFVAKLNQKGNLNWIKPVKRWKDTTEFHLNKINIDFNNNLSIYGALTDRWDTINLGYHHNYGLMRLKLNPNNGDETGSILYPNLPNTQSLQEDKWGNFYLGGGFSYEIKIGDKELKIASFYGRFIAKIKNDGVEEKPSTLLFPNPTNGLVQLEFENWNDPEIFYELYATNGQRIQNGSFLNQENVLDLNGLSNGLYFLRLKGSQKNGAMLKVMKY